MISGLNHHHPDRLSFRLAIVGGGRACKFFLEFIRSESFPLLDIELAGVCDIDPQAEGLVMAQEMGIYTTDEQFESLQKSYRSAGFECIQAIVDRSYDCG